MAHPSASWKEYVMYRRKVIERSKVDEEKLRNIQKLQKVPITMELLKETGIGRVLKQLCKENGEVGERANLLVNKWKGVVAKYRALNNKSEETISNCDKSFSKSHDKTDVSKNRKSTNGHTRNNGVFSNEHSLYAKQHKKLSASAADMDEDSSKDNDFYEEPDFGQTASERNMIPAEFQGNGVDDENSYDEDSVPYSGNEVSKYTSYSDYVQFAENEYNPEFPALFGTSKHHQPEDKNRHTSEQAEEEHVTCTQNGISSSHVGSDRFAAKHRSSHLVKNSSASTKLQESGKLNVSQSKYQSPSCAENSLGSSKVKRDEQHEASSQKRKYKSQSKLQDVSKSKERNLVSPKKHHSLKSGSPNDMSLKQKYYEETNLFLKDCSSSSNSPTSRSSSLGAEKHHDQNALQLGKKFKEELSEKFKESSKVNKTSNSGSSRSSLGNHSSKSSSSLRETIPKESNKIVKVSEKKHKETSSHKSKTNHKSSPSASKTAHVKDSLSVDNEGFTSTEVSFEDCLGFNDIVSVKKKKTSKCSSAAPHHSPKGKPLKSSISKELSKVSAESSKKSSSASHSKNKELSKSKSTSKPQNNLLEDNSKKKKKSKISESPDDFEVPKPPEMEVDIMSTLPEIQPNYKPLPSFRLDSPPQKRTTALTDEEAIMFTSSRKEKTAVYSGRKNHYATDVSSLQELCTRILIENIDGIGYIGGVPYMILKPVLERCTAKQLYTIEDFNAEVFFENKQATVYDVAPKVCLSWKYLLEDTGELWKQHCMRTYRNQHPEPGETWRDLYIRLHDEQESKLRSVTKNISALMSRATPVRQTKLAYVDSVVKPPRDVARKQAKHGTALPVNHTMKAGPPSKASPRPTAPGINAAASPKPSSPVPPSSSNGGSKVVKRTAPLMMKTLKDFKKAFRR